MNIKEISPKQISKAHKDPAYSAKLAGLSYVKADVPGISRVKGKSSGKGNGKNNFTYLDVKGKEIKDEATIARINSFGIPPAWKEVWISTKPKSHLQVTGIDAKGGKQYLYHPKWNAFRDTLKFARLNAFGHSLPKLRREITKLLKTEKDPTREKVIAATLRLVDLLALRIGNEEYAEENNTFGVTTLENRHVEIRGATIELNFVGKSHQEHSFEVKDETLAKIIKKELEIPGKRLFQYLDEEHAKHPLTSMEVNDFIKRVAGNDFTAKDFRTWSATAEAYKLMKNECACMNVDEKGDNKKDQSKVWKKSLRGIVSCVAEKLGNTVSVCRASYIHSDLLKAYEDGTFSATAQKIAHAKPHRGLAQHEVELEELLGLFTEERLKK